MTSPITAPAAVAERLECDRDGITWILTVDDREYTRRVEVVASEDHYGADADGRRGVSVSMLDVGSVTDAAPAQDSADFDAWETHLRNADWLVARWARNYTGVR